jgi:hypothetical protein
MRLYLYQIRVPQSRTRVRTNKLAVDTYTIAEPFPSKKYDWFAMPGMFRQRRWPFSFQAIYARKNTLIRHFVSHKLDF